MISLLVLRLRFKLGVSVLSDFFFLKVYNIFYIVFLQYETPSAIITADILKCTVTFECIRKRIVICKVLKVEVKN